MPMKALPSCSAKLRVRLLSSIDIARVRRGFSRVQLGGPSFIRENPCASVVSCCIVSFKANRRLDFRIEKFLAKRGIFFLITECERHS
jgi:hypothetical protein